MEHIQKDISCAEQIHLIGQTYTVRGRVILGIAVPFQPQELIVVIEGAFLAPEVPELRVSPANLQLLGACAKPEPAIAADVDVARHADFASPLMKSTALSNPVLIVS